MPVAPQSASSEKTRKDVIRLPLVWADPWVPKWMGVESQDPFGFNPASLVIAPYPAELRQENQKEGLLSNMTTPASRNEACRGRESVPQRGKGPSERKWAKGSMLVLPNSIQHGRNFIRTTLRFNFQIMAPQRSKRTKTKH